MTEVYTGRYSDNGLSEGDTVEFLESGNTSRNLYPEGQRRTLRMGEEYGVLLDERDFNGYDARYILVSQKREVTMSSFAQFVRKRDGLPPSPKEKSYSSKWRYPQDYPRWVDDYCCRIFLEDGNRQDIEDMFDWSTTPQGDFYWGDRYDGSQPVTQEDIEYIEWVLQHAE